ADRFGVAVTSRKPSVGYRETIKKPATGAGRPKKQSGGHGQSGDVVLDTKPLPRGSGFTFTDQIKGGVVPRNYIPSVEHGIIDALKHGPLGFQVVDLGATLIDGSYHTVDSSDMAFQLAGRLAINEGLPQCHPVLIEPIYRVEIVVPSEATAKMNALMSGRRGQILGFDTREGWTGWDVVKVQMPEAEIGDLIVEVRSATAGVGSYTCKFDHMAEVTGRTADQIVAARKAGAAAASGFVDSLAACAPPPKRRGGGRGWGPARPPPHGCVQAGEVHVTLRQKPLRPHPCKSRITNPVRLPGAVADGRPCHPWAEEPVPQRGTPSAVPSNPNSRGGRNASPIAQGGVKMDAIYVGIDVSKDRLDVHVRPSGEAFAVTRDGKGLDALVERFRALSPTLIAVEATGGFETIVAAAVGGAGLPLVVVNPAQIRHFAQALGKRAKTDPIDAAVIALFAEAVKPEL